MAVRANLKNVLKRLIKETGERRIEVSNTTTHEVGRNSLI
jgi:hypothetical protein